MAYPVTIPPILFICYLIYFYSTKDTNIAEAADSNMNSNGTNGTNQSYGSSSAPNHVLSPLNSGTDSVVNQQFLQTPRTPHGGEWEAAVLSDQESITEFTERSRLLEGIDGSDSASDRTPSVDTDRIKYGQSTSRRGRTLYTFWFLGLLSCSFVISFCFGHIHGDPIQNYFEWIYFALLLYTQWWGGMMKRTALQLDVWRAANSRNNWLFSLEWFMEFYWDLTYWMIYRYYTIFHVCCYQSVCHVSLFGFVW